MGIVRWMLAAAILFAALAVAGCQSRETKQARIRWVPTGTGWYQPDMKDITPQTGK
jgi:hypothetical protein